MPPSPGNAEERITSILRYVSRPPLNTYRTTAAASNHPKHATTSCVGVARALDPQVEANREAEQQQLARSEEAVRTSRALAAERPATG